ncbi:hypothetical protein AAFF_G00274600 [Aldrovandia affinis]|uniref:Uncharacterized protein n=1 Tax=Aldrovandia affinis TaxID=143900 RepID=A0AAD7SS33_9TELE|nr:hypothetical protein AAFF_G00274600 [Aldrovandia affinis]
MRVGCAAPRMTRPPLPDTIHSLPRRRGEALRDGAGCKAATRLRPAADDRGGLASRSRRIINLNYTANPVPGRAE